MEKELTLFEVIKRINVNGKEELTEKLIREKEYHLTDKQGNKVGTEIKMIFNYAQLQQIYKYNINQFVKNHAKGKIQITEEDIFDIILEVILNMPRSFKYINEGAMVNYIKLKVDRKIIDLYNKQNRFLTENNAYIESLDYIEHMENRYDYIDATTAYADMMFDNYNNKMARGEVVLNDTDVFVNIDVNTEKNIDSNIYIYDDVLKQIEDFEEQEQDEIIQAMKEYNIYLTNNQLEKFNKLLDAINDGEPILNEKDEFILVAVQKVLFPSRKGNANKDIQQFIDSCNKRFDAYWIRKKALKHVNSNAS